jgi:two-component system sensor histidine kinase/response regulator
MEQGLWVDAAENGQVALDKVAGDRFDLILMDMNMPVMDGYTARRADDGGPAGQEVADGLS